MSASCNILHLPFPKTPSSLFLPSPHRPLVLSRRRPLSWPAAASSWPAAGPIEPAVANPALDRANVLYFRSGYNVQIVVDEEEPEDVLMRRFRREVSKAGVIQECRRRRFFENKQEEKKRKQREAGRRNRRRRQGPRFNSSFSQADAETAKKTKEDDGDNWDLPEGDLPF